MIASCCYTCKLLSLKTSVVYLHFYHKKQDNHNPLRGFNGEQLIDTNKIWICQHLFNAWSHFPYGTVLHICDYRPQNWQTQLYLGAWGSYPWACWNRISLPGYSLQQKQKNEDKVPAVGIRKRSEPNLTHRYSVSCIHVILSLRSLPSESSFKKMLSWLKPAVV